MAKKQPAPAPAVSVVSDDGTVTPLAGGLAAKVETVLAPLATVFDKKAKRPATKRVKPAVASKGEAVTSDVKVGDKAPEKPEGGSAPRVHFVERDVPEPKLRVPPMPERRWEDSNESYNARVAKWAAAKDKARVAHEARLAAYHAGPKVRVEEVVTWTRNPAAPKVPEVPRAVGVGQFAGLAHLPKVPLSFEDRVTRLCVDLLRAETAEPSEVEKREVFDTSTTENVVENLDRLRAWTRKRLVAQACREAGHDVIVAANREGMLSGSKLTDGEYGGRAHAKASLNDFPLPPLKEVEHVVPPEVACCPICGHVVEDFKLHLKAQHLYPEKTSTVAKKAPVKKAAKKTAEPKAKKTAKPKAKKTAEPKAKKTAEPKAKKPRAKKTPNSNFGKETVHA